MKKNGFKKIVCLFLSLVLLFGGAVAAFADDEPVEPQAESVVARLYVCYHRSNQVIATGHVFLYVENLSEETQIVGVYDLPPNEGVSLGDFGFTRSDGFGIYYNTESYLYHDDGCQVLCLSYDLTEEELATFSRRIRYSNTWDFIFYNCVSFAFISWNTVAKPFLMPLVLPVFARLQIKGHGGTELPEMFYPARDRIYKQRGSGDGSYLEVVSDKSID